MGKTISALQEAPGRRCPVGRASLEDAAFFPALSLKIKQDIKAMSKSLKDRGIAFHLDGARLWEAQPFCGQTFHTICDNFDSVYVSFYKVSVIAPDLSFPTRSQIPVSMASRGKSEGGYILRAYS